MVSQFRVCLKFFLAVLFLGACAGTSAKSSDKQKVLKPEAAKSSIRVFEKKNQFAVEGKGKSHNFDLHLPKGFEVEKVYEEEAQNYKVLAYQYSNGEEAGSQVQVLDMSGPKLLWRKQIPGFNLSKPLVVDGAVYISVVDTVSKFDLKTGKVIWEKEGVNASHDFIGGEDIRIEKGVVHFSDKLQVRDKDGQFVKGGAQ